MLAPAVVFATQIAGRSWSIWKRYDHGVIGDYRLILGLAVVRRTP